MQTQTQTQTKLNEKEVYPPPASVTYIEGVLKTKYDFNVFGAPELPQVYWVERRKAYDTVPKYITTSYLLYPHLNLLVEVQRIKWKDSDKEYEEYISIRPWCAVMPVE
ncbi:MAG: hypothetical protein DRO39_06325 [Thermoprotei archaeon]|nr:MAG: hypothetical protein DRO39_06325 [Thermoprotei archaeon]